MVCVKKNGIMSKEKKKKDHKTTRASGQEDATATLSLLLLCHSLSQHTSHVNRWPPPPPFPKRRRPQPQRH